MSLSVDPEKEFDIELLADRPEFIPQVAKWYYNEWGFKDSENSFEATCKRIKGKLNRENLPLHLIAFLMDEPLGVVQLKFHEMEEYPQYEHWLGSVYVSPKARGRGVARELVFHASDLAQELGISELYLQTEQLDGGIYANAGWQPIEQIISKGDEVLVMVKKVEV